MIRPLPLATLVAALLPLAAASSHAQRPGSSQSGLSQPGAARGADAAASKVGTARVLTIRADRIRQPLLGVGAQIWPGDDVGHSVLDELGLRYARMHHGVNFWSFAPQPPADANTTPDDNWAAMYAYIAANFNGPNGSEPWHLPAAQESFAFADARGIGIILNEFLMPSSFLDAGQNLKGTALDDYATYWSALVAYLDANGMRPEFVELANEPNGTWNGFISPPRYDALVAMTRASLDAAGFPDVGILGPGLSELGGTKRWSGWWIPSWFSSLTTPGIDAIAGWSAHAWDDWAGLEGQLGRLFSAIGGPDPLGQKPVFVTEFSTTRTIFGGVTYVTPESGGDAADQNGFAIHAVATMLDMLDAGVAAPVFWESADQSWSQLTWGLKRANGSKRPAFRALATLLPRLPENGLVVRPTWDEPELSIAAVRGANELVVALANTGSTPERRTLRVEGLQGVQLVRMLRFHKGTTSRPPVWTEGPIVHTRLPPASLLTLVFRHAGP